MHESVFYAAAVWMAVLMAVAVIVAIRDHSPLGRLLALDTVSVILVALLVLYSVSRGVSWYLDGALVLALLGFIATAAAARYYSGGEVLQ